MAGRGREESPPTIDDVDVVAIGALCAGAGAAIGLAAGLAFRISERMPERDAAAGTKDELPDGLDDVLSAVRPSALVVDPEGRVVKAGPAAYAFGVLRGSRLVIPELDVAVNQVRRDGEIRELSLTISRSRSDDRHRHVAARVAPLGSHVLVLMEDRTQAIRNDEVRRDFVANVSHELKTPIGALMVLAEAVQDASDDPEAVERFAERMQREGTRLSHLVQEIIDLSRLQYDDPVDSPEPVEIDQVVADALDRSRVDADTNDIQLVTGSDTGIVVQGDAQQLTMALGNLVENAVNYSPSHTKVAVVVRRLEDRVEVAVTDQGLGIADEDVDRIFERFYRIDPARSRATGGTGLGLSIVKHIAAAHGGDVHVWSVPGTGSTFNLSLPFDPVRSGNITKAAPKSDWGAATDIREETL